MKLDEFKEAVLEICPNAIFDTFTPGKPINEDADFIFAYSNENEHILNCGFASFTGKNAGSPFGFCDVYSCNERNWTFKDTNNVTEFKEMLKNVELEPSKYFSHLTKRKNIYI